MPHSSDYLSNHLYEWCSNWSFFKGLIEMEGSWRSRKVCVLLTTLILGIVNLFQSIKLPHAQGYLSKKRQVLHNIKLVEMPQHT